MNIEERRERQKIAKRKAKEIARGFVISYLMEHPCVDCNEADPTVLTFDHVRGEKRYNIADMISHGLGIETIKKEISLTEVVCFNCHVIREQTRNKTYRWSMMNGNGG